MATYVLRKVTRVGTRCYVRRVSDGANLTELTAEEYAALAVKGADVPPNRSGLDAQTWADMWHTRQTVAVGGVPVYDTPSGRMEPGDVAQDRTEIRVCIPDVPRGFVRFQSSDLTSGSLEDVSRLTCQSTSDAAVSILDGVATVDALPLRVR